MASPSIATVRETVGAVKKPRFVADFGGSFCELSYLTTVFPRCLLMTGSLALACASNGRPGAADEDGSGDPSGQGIASQDAAPAMGDYPQGPYGQGSPEVGSVVENLSFEGLLNLEPPAASAGLAARPVDLQTFRDTGARYLLLITAMGWCGSCQAAARELGGELAPRVGELFAQGGVVAEVLLEGRGSSAPTHDEIVAWATASELNVSLIGPASERVPVVFPEREWGFILRLDTMQVVWRTQVDLYAEPTVSRQGIEELARRVAE